VATIFVNYRSGAHAASVEAFAEKLRARFGVDQVFLDVHSIPAGAPYPEELRAHIEAAAVVLVVIHPGWSSAADKDGRRLLDQPGDWVRFEIGTALQLGKRVIQVLLDTEPLTAGELPPSIRKLAVLQAKHLRRGSFADDVRKLADELPTLVPELAKPLQRFLRIGLVLALVVALIVAGTLFLRQNLNSSTTATAGEPPTYLTDVDFIDESLDLSSGSVRINGTTYRKSLIYDCSSSACLDPKASVEYNLAGRYKHLYVVAGVLENASESRQVGHFQIYVDDRIRADVDVTLRQPRELPVDVTNAARLRLVAYREGTVTDPGKANQNQTNGVSNKLPSLAWGDPRVSG
jgi:hypothetical protein